MEEQLEAFRLLNGSGSTFTVFSSPVVHRKKFNADGFVPLISGQRVKGLVLFIPIQTVPDT